MSSFRTLFQLRSLLYIPPNSSFTPKNSLILIVCRSNLLNQPKLIDRIQMIAYQPSIWSYL